MSGMNTDNTESKTCAKCGKAKAITEFHVDRSTFDSRKRSCRLCNKVKADWRKRNGDRVRAQKRESYDRTRAHYLEYNRSNSRRERAFAWNLMRKFGITVQQFEDMLEAQAGRCAICGKSPEEANGHRHKHRLHVDHDHGTGRVRGLLCNNCNAGLGYLGDSMKNLKKAIQYLNNPSMENEKCSQQKLMF